MKVALYARVSTADQNCSMQLRELRQYAAARGWEIDSAGEYVDTGFSGSKDSRPQLNRLMADARQRRFDIVLVWKLDRFARSVSHTVRAIQEFTAVRVAFIAVTQNIDTSADSPMGKFQLHILAAVAELERELIRERVQAGLSNARAKGRIGGRPRRVFRRDEARAMRAEGKSWREIARALRVPVTTVVDACTENPSASTP
jgi:putative DNA-invertase from lambdoid prophage Rac